MKRSLALMCVLALSPAGPAPAAAPGARLEDFAYSAALDVAADGGLHRLAIPQSVYQGVTRADLGDLRIFNHAGELVPHAFLPRPPNRPRTTSTTLPVFALFAPAGAQGAAWSASIEQRPDGTLVSRLSAAPAGDTRTLHGYLVDTGTREARIDAVEIVPQAHAGELFGALRIEGSDDLNAWRTLIDGATVADLGFAGQRLTQTRVDLRGASARYLRIGWSAGQPPIPLAKVQVEFAAGVQEPERQWRTVTLVAGKEAGQYQFDIGAGTPVDRLRVQLPEPDTLAAADLMAREQPDGQWRAQRKVVLYRMQRDGHELRSADIDLPASGYRHWMLQVDQRAGGLGKHAPQIEIGWVPGHLVFLPRGAGPFTLAYGNARTLPNALPIETLVPGWSGSAQVPAARARVAAPREVAGRQALAAAPDYKVWALWAALALGVIVLGGMAWQLARSLKSPPG